MNRHRFMPVPRTPVNSYASSSAALHSGRHGQFPALRRLMKSSRAGLRHVIAAPGAGLRRRRAARPPADERSHFGPNQLACGEQARDSISKSRHHQVLRTWGR
jgi:hypothetical protein